jgi:hypothetical protein
MLDHSDDPCHECGRPVGKNGKFIVTTVTDDHSVSIVGHALCVLHKDDKLAVDKCVWSIQRTTGK